MAKSDPAHRARFVKSQAFSNAPGMADGAIGPYVLMTLVDRMIGT